MLLFKSDPIKILLSMTLETFLETMDEVRDFAKKNRPHSKLIEESRFISDRLCRTILDTNDLLTRLKNEMPEILKSQSSRLRHLTGNEPVHEVQSGRFSTQEYSTSNSPRLEHQTHFNTAVLMLLHTALRTSVERARDLARNDLALLDLKLNYDGMLVHDGYLSGITRIDNVLFSVVAVEVKTDEHGLQSPVSIDMLFMYNLIRDVAAGAPDVIVRDDRSYVVAIFPFTR